MTLTAVSPMRSRKSEAPPRWATQRRLDRPTYGGRLGAVGKLLGQPLMPWQQLVPDVGLEYDPETKIPFYREVVVTVMRQSGKSTLVLTFETDRCVSWGSPQRVAYTAQTGWDARRKLLDDQVPMLQASPLWGAVTKVYRAQGAEGVLWDGGSRIDVMASSSSAGHGRTLDLGVIDEAFDDEDDRREQSILPAMATRPEAQLLVVSTAGTDRSTYLRRKIEAGRHAAEADIGHGVAYFEWSIPPESDVDDPEVWWAHMPALGWTISEAAVAHARQTMSDKEFRRGFGNQWVDDENDRIIPESAWLSVQDAKAAPAGPLRLGVDCLDDRSSGSIVSVGAGVVELIDHRDGAGWLVERSSALAKKWDAVVVIDGGGPAAYVADELERDGVRVERLTSAEVAAACGRIYDDIADGRAKFRPHLLMDDAVAGLAKRPIGDRFVWSRAASSTDITPFMAATLAYRPSGAPAPFMIRGR